MNTNDSVNKKSTNYFLIGFGILISILIIITIIWLVITTIKCNDKCNTNGDCSLLTGKCNCKKGYKGDRCKEETKEETKEKTKEETKEKTKDKCSDKCNYSGVCDENTGECKCNDEYYGSRCEIICERGYDGKYGEKYNTTTKKCESQTIWCDKHDCFKNSFDTQCPSLSFLQANSPRNWAEEIKLLKPCPPGYNSSLEDRICPLTLQTVRRCTL